jgi:hypothetical protein
MAVSAVLRALQHVWYTLEPLNFPMAVMGGLALAAWQHVRATRDVDLLINLKNMDLDRLLETLAAHHIEPMRIPPASILGTLRIIQLQYEPAGTFAEIQIDLLLADNPYHEEALARRVPLQLAEPKLDIFVLSCEDMILHKLLAGRLIDRVDATALLRLNRPALNIGYLRQWATKLGLVTELDETWKEALPGQC